MLVLHMTERIGSCSKYLLDLGRTLELLCSSCISRALQLVDVVCKCYRMQRLGRIRLHPLGMVCIFHQFHILKEPEWSILGRMQSWFGRSLGQFLGRKKRICLYLGYI